MSEGINGTLILAVTITVGALAWFGWYFLSSMRRVAYLVSESTVPRRYLLLGFLVGLGILYLTRR